MEKQKFIIFDFNRTIFSPEKKSLIPNTRTVLSVLKQRGCRLYLVSRPERSRSNLIKKLKVDKYFCQIFINNNKLLVFRQICRSTNLSRKNIFVVGDRIRQEITSGNKLGLKTVWLKQGKFSQEIPRTKEEKPNYVINDLKQVLKII